MLGVSNPDKFIREKALLDRAGFSPIARILFIFSLFFIAGIPPSLAQAPGSSSEKIPSAAEYFRQASQAANRFDLPLSERILKDALERYPDDWPLNRLSINVHDKAGRIHEVIPYYTQRMAMEPANVTGYAGFAVASSLSGTAFAAESQMPKILELAPGSLAALDAAALIERAKQEKNRTRTIAAYERLLAAYPGFSMGYDAYLEWLNWGDFGFGLILKRNGNERAIRSVIERARRQFGSETFYMDYESKLLGQDRWHEARKIAEINERILAIDPSRMSIKMELSRIYGDLGDATRQGRLLEEIVREAPGYVEGWFELAHYYEKMSQYDRANEIHLKLKTGQFEGSPSWLREYAKRGADLRRAENLLNSGKFDEAAALLKESLRTDPDSNLARLTTRLLTAVLSRTPEDRIRRLDNVPYLKQRDNYCGPAALSMALGYWGTRRSQDEIASAIYTGIAGTAAQTIELYCAAIGFTTRSFRGNVASWRRLLDQGIPILWLKYTSFSDGHYCVVTGYNDITKQFILHNPWNAWESGVDYDKLDDEWVFPTLRQSLAILPAGWAKSADLSRLDAPLSFRLINAVIYLATGSNLTRRFFPGVLLNLAFSGLFVLVGAGLIAWSAWPRSRRRFVWYVLLNCGLVFVLCALIGYFRMTRMTSLLVAWHLGMGAFTSGLMMGAPLAVFLKWRATPGQLMRLAAVCVLYFAAVAWVDQYGVWARQIPKLLLIVGVASAFWENLLMLARGRLRSWPNGPIACVPLYRRLGSACWPMRGALGAWLGELTVERRRGEFSRAVELADALLAIGGLGRHHTERIERLRIECLLLRHDQDPAGGAKDLDRAGLLLGEIESRKTNPLSALYREALRARWWILRGDWDSASRVIERTQNALDASGPRLWLLRLIERARGNWSDFSSFARWRLLNRLRLARQRGDLATVQLIRKQHQGLLDVDYLRLHEFDSLTRGPFPDPSRPSPPPLEAPQPD